MALYLRRRRVGQVGGLPPRVMSSSRSRRRARARPSSDRAVPSREDVLGAGPADFIVFDPDKRNHAGLSSVDEIWSRCVRSKEGDRFMRDTLDKRAIKP